MDKNADYMPFQGYDPNFDARMNNMDPMFNPMMQYEQAYMYYRYLTCQMEYKIRCKEYEQMCKKDGKPERRVIE